MRVGTSNSVPPQLIFLWDHPHACGDKINLKRGERNVTGSSPCVWGQVYLGYVWHPKVRIIPMRVGTRKQANTFYIDRKDHPHACGDKRSLV